MQKKATALKRLQDPSVNVEYYTSKMAHIVYGLLQSQNYKGFTDLTTLPELGFVVFHNDIPVCCAFLRKVEGGYAQIDTMVSNAKVCPVIRNYCLDIIVDELIRAAKYLKLDGILALTADKSVLKRAEVAGFHVVPETVIALPLREY